MFYKVLLFLTLGMKKKYSSHKKTLVIGIRNRLTSPCPFLFKSIVRFLIQWSFKQTLFSQDERNFIDHLTDDALVGQTKCYINRRFTFLLTGVFISYL